MKHFLLSIALCLGIVAGVSAQITTPNGAKSNQINAKIHEVDMLLQIMPLLLTKEQINGKLLPAIEKNRESFKKELIFEDDELAKMEAMLDEALSGAYNKGSYPPRKITGDVAERTAKLATQRRIFVGVITENMIETVKATLNAGQLKALIGSFDPRFIDPTVKPETITDDRKLRFFVDRVFLDDTTYEILKKLGK